ncbi:MAG: DUF58 domain-containing protein [Thermoguttaceae bacterium]|nr:DUF58 domain-containing protein [Thermoguttaceae bacterium]
MNAGIFDYWGYLAFPTAIALPTAAALFFRVFPTRRALAAVAVPAIASLAFFVALAVDGDAWARGAGLGGRLVAALDCVVALILAFDWATVVWAGRKLTASRKAEPVASVGVASDVELTLENRSSRAVSLEIVDDSNPNADALPARDETEAFWESDEEAATLDGGARFEMRTIPGGQKETFRYRLRWNRRGEYVLEFVALRLVGRLGFWSKYRRVPCSTTFRAYPNLRRLASFDMLGRAASQTLLGLRRTRTVGQNDEFERLRDYEEGDQYKFIDWRATAKRNKLTTRVFQAAKNQRIMLAIDAGRMTANRASGVSFFDAALNSTLALAYLALKQGDEVGCLVFSDEAKRYVAPRGGMAQINALICGLYDVFPERVESRYDRAFAYLASRLTKRSLIVLATNVMDERNAEQIERVATSLNGKHLPLGLFFRDRSLFDAVERWEKRAKEAEDESATAANASGSDETKNSGRFDLGWARRETGSDDEIERFLLRETRPEDATADELFYRAGAAAEILNWRRRTLRRLEARGALTLDVFPEDAAAPLINKYLEVKARRLL